MTRRDITIRTIAAGLASIGAAAAWWRMFGTTTTLTRILPAVILVVIAFGLGTAGGKRVARGAGALLALAATFIAGLIFGAMTLDNAQGNVSPASLIDGIFQGIGTLLRSPVPAAVNSDTVTPAIIFSGYVTVVACLLICTKAPASALGATFVFFLGITALTEGSLQSATISGLVFVFFSLAALYLVPTGGSTGTITDGVEFAEPQRGPKQGKVLHGVVILIISFVISGLGAYTALAIGIGSQRQPFDPHITNNYRPQTDTDPITQVNNWQSIARNSEIPLVSVIGEELPTALTWAAEATYNGTNWSTSGTYDNAQNPLPYAGPDTSMTRPIITVTRTTNSLPGPWLPTFPLVTQMEGLQIRVNADGGVIARSDVAANLQYGTVSQFLALRSLKTLQNAKPANQTGYSTTTELPPGFPQDLQEYADTVMSVGTTDYARLTELAKSLSGKPYRLDNTAFGDILNYTAINTFVTKTKVGTQAQFATAFALMARSQKYASRVVAGFAVPSPTGGNITSQQALVWPEVKFEGIGWVAFAPAPGDVDRGVPVPAAYTPPPTPPTPPPPPPQPEPAPEESGSLWPVVLTLVVVIAVLAIAGWVFYVRKRRVDLHQRLQQLGTSRFGPWVWAVSVRRHLHAATPHSPVAASTGKPLDAPPPRTSAVLRRLTKKQSAEPESVVEELPSGTLAELARLAQPALYGPTGATSEELARGWKLADTESAAVRSAAGFTGLLRWTFLPIKQFDAIDQEIGE